MPFLKYISNLLLILFPFGFSWAQTELILLTPQIPSTYEARDNVKLDSSFYAKSTLGNYKIATNPNIVAVATYNKIDEQGIISTQPFSTSAAVGTMVGHAMVDDMGAAKYVIPLHFVSGTAAIAPHLSLVYHSQQLDNDIMGEKWKIDGLSSIVLNVDTNAWNEDTSGLHSKGAYFTLDGQRLINTNGDYGMPGSRYRLEMKAATIEIPANGLGFIMFTDEGKIVEYGTTDDARIWADSSKKSVVSWKLNRVSDANGNYMVYEYNQDHGESWLKSIAYTGNVAGDKPFAQIQFYYDFKNEAKSTLHPEGILTQKRILTSIIHVVHNIQVRKYELIYSYIDMVSYLTEIKMSGKNRSAYNTTKFDWVNPLENALDSLNAQPLPTCIHKIIDGYNQVTTFSYDRLSNAGLYSPSDTDSLLAKSHALSTSNWVVVRELTLPQGDKRSFHFTGLRYHLEKNIPLGFNAIEQISHLNKQKIIKEFEVDHFQSYLKRVGLYTDDGLFKISDTLYARKFTYGTHFGNLNEISVSIKDYLLETRNELTKTYDANGNVIFIEDITYDATVAGNEVYLKTIKYDLITQDLLSRPLIHNVTTNIFYKTDEQNSTQFTTHYTYDEKGNVVTKTDFYELPQAITTYYRQRDQFGNAQIVVTSAAEVLPKTTQVIYEETGRFVTKHSNALNQVTTKTYDEEGNVLTFNDLDGQQVKYAYDDFGNLTSTKQVLSAVLCTYSLEWETNMPGALYKKTIVTDFRPSLIIYFDALGREIKTVTEGFSKLGSRNIVKTKSYFPNGALEKESFPYDDSEGTIPQYTSYGYDQFNRLHTIQKMEGLNATKIAYNARVMTITDPSGLIHQQTQNAMGKIMAYAENGAKNVRYKYTNFLTLKEVNAEDFTTSFTYDSYGRKTQYTDPVTGLISYKYDSYGRLLSQTDPEYTSQFAYDVADRLSYKTVGDERIDYIYGTSGGSTNQVISAISSTGASTLYGYNQWGKIATLVESNNAESFTTTFDYDFEGKETTHTYPTGFATEKVYDALGNIVKIVRNDTKDVIWELNETTASGQISAYSFGKKGGQLHHAYNAYGGLEHTVVTSEDAILCSAHYRFDPNTNLLMYRNRDGRAENFDYDELQQLSNIYFDLPITNPTVALRYAANGTIISKSDIGAYFYQRKPFAVSKISSSIDLYKFNSQSITYDALGKVNTIAALQHHFNFHYDAMHHPSKMAYVNVNNSNLNYTRYYAHSFVKNTTVHNTQNLHYIQTPVGIAAVYVNDNVAEDLFHVVNDYQGSPLLVLREDGTIVAQNNYDAWGSKRIYNAQTNSFEEDENAPSIFPLGFRGMEMLPEVGLMTQNGDLYDFRLGNWLNPSHLNNVPFQYQSFNPYVFQFNNPLK